MLRTHTTSAPCGRVLARVSFQFQLDWVGGGLEEEVEQCWHCVTDSSSLWLVDFLQMWWILFRRSQRICYVLLSAYCEFQQIWQKVVFIEVTEWTFNLWSNNISLWDVQRRRRKSTVKYLKIEDKWMEQSYNANCNSVGTFHYAKDVRDTRTEEILGPIASVTCDCTAATQTRTKPKSSSLAQLMFSWRSWDWHETGEEKFFVRWRK